MFKGDYNFWLAYHYGKIHRKLTEKEYSEIRASEFAMHLLIPTGALLMECGGAENLANMNIFHNYPKIRELANKFKVPEDVMVIKISCILAEMEKEKNKKENNRKRVLKRDKNIIYAKFN